MNIIKFSFGLRFFCSLPGFAQKVNFTRGDLYDLKGETPSTLHFRAKKWPLAILTKKPITLKKGWKN